MGLAYVNSQAATGTCTLTAPASLATWNLTALSVSMAGPTAGPNAKVTIYDGSITGTVLHAEFLPGPTTVSTGSVGSTYEVKIPKGPNGNPGIQASPGAAMTIVVNGTGANQVSINARFNDGQAS